MTTQRIVKLCFVAVVAAAVLASCASDAPTQERIPTVKIDTVRLSGGQSVATFPGRVKASADANLAFRVAGTLLRVPVNAGSQVRKGDLLAELDPRDYRVQLSATEAEYSQVKAEVDRVIELHERKGIPDNDYDKAVYGLRQIEAKLAAHRNALADTRLLAPFDGYVQQRIYEEGETVGAGMPVIAMVGNDGIEVEISLPSSEYLRRSRFASFACRIDALGSREFALEPIAINHKANLNQLYTMRLRLRPDNSGAAPTPGMAATVSIRIDRDSQQAETRIPLTAVVEHAGGPAVWVYRPESGTVGIKPIRISEIRKNGTAVVSEGLGEGELIVCAGVHSLHDGQKVKPLPAKSRTNIGGLL